MNFVTRFTTLLTLLALAACGNDSTRPTPPPDGGGNEPPPPVITAPTITSQPVSATINEGGTVTFTVVASGESLAYQWRRNGTAIAGATAASYTTPALAPGDDQSLYSVTVTNAGGSVTSNNATLTVTTAPPPTGGGEDDPLQPLPGPAEPFPQTPAPIAATPVIQGVTPNHNYLLSWDPSSNGQFSLGFLHGNGAETRILVPANSFLDDAWITTADVTDLGPAVTAVIAAINIEPGDYVTEKTITANFTIPDAVMAGIDPAQLIGFVADSDGSNLHMVPLGVGNFGATISRPAIRLNRLGIVGIAVATPAQQATLATAWPTDAEDRLNAVLAPSLTAQWRAAVMPATATSKLAAAATDDNPAIAALRGYYNDVLVPAFAAADGDPTQIPSAVSTGFGFLRMAALSGQDGPDGSFQVVAGQVTSRIHSLMERYADYLADQCRTVGGVNEMQKMLGVIRQLQLLGNGSKAAEIEEVLPQCSRFKGSLRVDYTRNANYSLPYSVGGINGTETIQSQAHVVIEGSHNFGLGDNVWNGQLRLTTLDWREDRYRDNNQEFHSTWASNGEAVPWAVTGITVPVVRTRGGTPSSSVRMFLSPFIDLTATTSANFRPFTATVTTRQTRSDGTPGPDRVDYGTQVSLEVFVPALPSDGTRIYGPMLVPGSGTGTSQRTRTIPYHGGSIVESETVTLTVSRAD